MKIKKIKKKAQYMNHKPSSLFEPRGSDLSGRFPSTEFGSGSDFGWGLLAQQYQGIPIEQRLGRQYMSPLPEGLSQESDSYELQLRKYRAGDEVGDPHKNIEELLELDHDDSLAYLSTEELLEENRPKPLMITISDDDNIQDPSVSWYERAEKSKDRLTKESSIVKTASFFGVFDGSSPWGWQSNLDIPIEDRIWSAEEDESEQQDRSSKIRSQFRYNPTYTNGIYFELDNVRGFPYPADNPNNNRMSLHPLERMASDNSDQIYIDGKLSEVFSLLSSTKKNILSGESLSVRFIATEDFFPVIGSVFDDNRIRVDLFETENYLKGTKETIYSVWVSISDIPLENIENLESFLTYGNRDNETDVLVEKLLGNDAVKTKKEMTIKKILSEVKDICEQYEIKDVCLIGGVSRDIAMGNSLSDISNLDFSAGWINQSLKVGGLLAERLGVKEVAILHRTMTIRFEYDSIKIDFKGMYSPPEIRGKLRDRGIKTTSFNMDVYNRDFTINMLVYNILNGKIVDICGESKADLDQGLIRTYFDPDFVCQENPLIILRALKLMVRYDFTLCPSLYDAILNFGSLLFDGRYSDERLILERNQIKREGEEKADSLINACGLEKLNSLE